MKTEIIPIYTCEFCGKYYKRKYFAERHEKYCHDNPNNHHSCFDGCMHLKKSSKLVNEEFWQVDFECTVLKKMLYSYKAESRDHPHTRDGNHERMPLKCDSFQFEL